MLIAPSSYGALSATSAHTIQGRAPTIQNNRLGFKVNGASYSQAIGNIDPSVAKAFDAGLSFSHFKIMDLTSTDYYDADGDVAHSTTPFTMGTKSIKWYDSNDTEITDLAKTLGCGNNYSLPLKLRIEIQDVEVHSKYGDPRDSSPTTLAKEYLISPASGICYVKPGSLHWWGSNGNYQSGSSLRDPTTGGGYTSDFILGIGFKAQPTESRDKFPTTGFSGARFMLDMSGSQTDYNYMVTNHPQSVVTVDTNGWVTLKKNPRGAVTVRATSKASSSTYFDYEFNPTRLWVLFKKSQDGTHAQAKSKCGTGVIDGVANTSKIPTRADLSNAPQIAHSVNSGVPASYLTRAIGKIYEKDAQGNLTNNVLAKENILGEWGKISNINYPGSDIINVDIFLRTRDEHPPINQYQFHYCVVTGPGFFNKCFDTSSHYYLCLE
ncbi:hypothetical protein RCS94_02460 [Orbaceae bacterium ac157xtp]